MAKAKPSMMDEIKNLPDPVIAGKSDWRIYLELRDKQFWLDMLLLIDMWLASDPMLRSKFPYQKNLAEFLTRKVNALGVKVSSNTLADVIRERGA